METSSTPLAPKKILYSDKDMELAIRMFKDKKIPVYEPGSDDYERYIATSNLIYRFSSPPCVVRPRCSCDVRDIIKIAEPKKISITIKNGGHSFAGGSTTNIGILMELGLMNQVDIDMTPDCETVSVKAGALWFHVYNKLTHMRDDGKLLDGWIANGGRCPTVGVSGFMLGGGLCPFTRSFGMGCDTVKEFTIVTATGDEVTVSEDNGDAKDKNDLFWALRGAGGGNFGIVVQMKMTLKKLKSDVVIAGRYTWYPEKDETSMPAFLGTMNSFYTWSWPNEMTIDSSWLCDLQETKSDIGVRFLVYYNGDRAEFDKTVDEWTLKGDPAGSEQLKGQHDRLKEQLKMRSLEEPSSRFLHETLAAQWVEETKKALPTSKVYQIYTSFVFHNDGKVFEKITETIKEQMQNFRKQFAGENGLMQVTFIHSGGEATLKQCTDTAFPWREAIYHAYVMLQWDEKWLEKPMRKFLGEAKTALSDLAMVKLATFINFPDDTLTAGAYETSYYGDNHQRLREIKKNWDPGYFFEWPQGIRLPEGAAQTTTGAVGDREVANVEPNRIEPLIPEERLTDVIARRQWETYRTNLHGGGDLPLFW